MLSRSKTRPIEWSNRSRPCCLDQRFSLYLCGQSGVGYLGTVSPVLKYWGTLPSWGFGKQTISDPNRVKPRGVLTYPLNLSAGVEYTFSL